MYSALADACTYSIRDDGRKSKEGMIKDSQKCNPEEYKSMRKKGV